jgi:NAD(P)-dependent dehydrogenase (short-subunit alcohol dehydrogenase family)
VKVADKVAIVTGGGNGIGAALATKLAQRDARVVVADLDGDAAQAVADRINAEHPGVAVASGGDVSETAHIGQLITLADNEFGPVDLYFANAGITGVSGLDVTDAEWDQSLDVNLRAHIRAAQLLVPGWVGLLTQLGSATYSVTKHAAVGFAEWLNITFGDQGVRVSCLCPMGVNTKLLYSPGESDDPLARLATRAVTSAGDVIEPNDVADIVLAAVDDERFLILPHPAVLEMYRHKGADYDRWLRGMRRYQHSLMEGL